MKKMLGVLVLFCALWSSVRADAPALFAFGDSLVDAGDNAHVGYPYGIDFPGGTASRFSNGKLVVDFLASHLGLPLPPAYYDAGNDVQKGANFACAGSGVLPQTTGGGQNLASQISDFQKVAQQLTQTIGTSSSSDYVANSIFYICSGNNDVNNMYQRGGSVSTSYLQSIATTLTNDIKTLYNSGARKFVIVGLSAVGCIPLNVKNGQCAQGAQAAAQAYNQILETSLESLRSSLDGVQIVMTKFFNLMVDVHNNPGSYGFTDSTTACCPEGSNAFGCSPSSQVCPDRTKYSFWDAIHQTQAFNSIAADKWWSGGSSDVTPMNIQKLASS